MKLQNLIHIVIGILCIGLLPRAQAVIPPPDGGYPGFNTAEGQNALFGFTSGTANTAVGWHSLSNNSEGSFNTATGAGALRANTASDNTAFGAAALFFNTIGFQNTAVGTAALLNNTTGDQNTANGAFALSSNTEGVTNTAIGNDALKSNTTGDSNTALGFNALPSNTTGSFNMAVGHIALTSNTDGSANTAVGRRALELNTTGSYNTAIGFGAGGNLTTGYGNVCIGEGILGVAGESDTTRIRNVYSSVASARAVYVNSDSKIGTLVSSRRFKDEIKSMDNVSEAILALKPVTFRYKKEIEPNGATMFGLIAEEVEKVDPDLVTRDDKGEAETVRYEAVNAMLLNEFLKEHRKNEEQQATITELKSTITKQQKDFHATAAQQQKQIQALTTGLQKVSAQLEASKPPTQVVNNPLNRRPTKQQFNNPASTKEMKPKI